MTALRRGAANRLAPPLSRTTQKPTAGNAAQNTALPAVGQTSGKGRRHSRGAPFDMTAGSRRVPTRPTPTTGL